jgi:hypothetical protein
MARTYRGRHASRPRASTARRGLHARPPGSLLRSRASRRLAIVLACAAVLTGVVTAIPWAPATGVTSRFTAVADAYVSRTREHRNFGSSPALRTTARPRLERSYLRFAVTGLSGDVTAARLRLYAATASRAGYAVHAVAAGGWAESTITYATAPAPSGIVATSGPVASDTWTSVDITRLVHGDGLLDVVLATDSRSALYASRETGATAPQLVIETAGTAASSQTTTTTSSTTTSTTLRSTTTTTAAPSTSATTSTTRAPAPSGASGYGTPERPFSASSAWNRPIPADASLAANSAGMIRRLSSGGHYNVTNGAWGQMGAPVFYADASTPRHTWGAHCGAISGKQVPIPPGSHEAQGPGANTDHKYIVIDRDAKLVYDIWGADVEGRDCLKWGYQGAGVIESLTTANDGAPGVGGQQAPTGAGTSSLAGLLRGYDATHLDEDGTYGHALQGARPPRATDRIPVQTPSRRAPGSS